MRRANWHADLRPFSPGAPLRSWRVSARLQLERKPQAGRHSCMAGRSDRAIRACVSSPERCSRRTAGVRQGQTLADAVRGFLQLNGDLLLDRV